MKERAIVLNVDGEVLLSELEPTLHIAANCADKAFRLGQHEVCSGTISIRSVTHEFSAITCNECFLRVVVPTSLNTIAKLEETLPIVESRILG